MSDSYQNLMTPSRDMKFLLDVVSEVNGEMYDAAANPNIQMDARLRKVEVETGDFGLTVVVHTSEEVLIKYMGVVIWNSEDDPRYSPKYGHTDDGKEVTLMTLKDFLLHRMYEIADFSFVLIKQMHKQADLIPQRELPLEED
jgi:hypothetical protein